MAIDKRDYPKVGKAEADNNRVRGGSLNCTRGYLRRLCAKTFLISALTVGISYVFNAADGMINGDNYDNSSDSNNNKNRNNNGNRR